LFECRNGKSYIVLEDPNGATEAIHVVLRLDGEPTRFVDTSQVFYTLTMETLEALQCAWKDY